MENSTPSYMGASDPRIYGFSDQGLVLDDTFNPGFGGSVPSSDSAPAVRASHDGTVSVQAQEQAAQQAFQNEAPENPQVPVQVPMQAPAQTGPQPVYGPGEQNAQTAVSRQDQSTPYLYPGVPNSGAYAGLVNRQQPAQPPARHSGPPGYPWHGHPNTAYSQPLLGPNGTSPMRRGGPNLPAYATAPQQPMGYTGAVYPLNTPGVQEQNNGNPLFGGFAGVDFGSLDAHLDSELGRTKKEKLPKSRDAQGGGGWVYRQFADGSIQIVVSNSASLPVGKQINAQSHPRQWNAITAEIGTWQQFLKDRWAKRGQTALTLLDAGTKVAGQFKGRRRKKRRRRRRRKAAPSPASDIVYDTGEEDEGEGEGLPPWALPALLGFLALGGLVFVATRNPPPSPRGRGRDRDD